MGGEGGEGGEEEEQEGGGLGRQGSICCCELDGKSLLGDWRLQDCQTDGRLHEMENYLPGFISLFLYLNFDNLPDHRCLPDCMCRFLNVLTPL